MRMVPIALALASPREAEVVSASSNGFEVRETVNVATLLRRRLSLHSASVGSWWDPEHTYSGSAANLSLDAEPGGCFCERLPNGGGVEHMRVTYVAPGKRIVLTGSLGPLLLRSHDRRDGRQVREHRQWNADYARLSRGGLRQRRRGQDRPGGRSGARRTGEPLERAYLAANPLVALQRAEAKRRATVLRVVRLAPRSRASCAECRGSGMQVSPGMSSSTSVSSSRSASGRNSAKISAPPMTETGSPAASSSALSTLFAFSAPIANQLRSRVRTMCRRPGSKPGRLSKVLRPITIALPIVSALKRLRSAGRCHGSLPSRPMIPFCARATTSVIDGFCIAVPCAPVARPCQARYCASHE